MKGTILKAAGVFVALLSASFANNINAQNTNIIKEVKINPNDGFNELRKLVAQNFDFTNPNLTEGEVESIVKFEIAENGKLKNIHAEGDCKYVNQEMEETMKDLIYTFKNEKGAPYIFVMPVKFSIASR
ncbi:MAG: hypothetical protein Q4G16_00915 [Cruoricaptor ignavus]|nr:hypothetical protein [Cruoricaptor ignavus]